MRSEHLQSWLAAVTHEERPDTENWGRVVDIIQAYFWGFMLTTEFTWKMLLLITQGNGEFRGVGPVEVLWKSLFGVINWRFGGAVQFHDVLHGFRVSWGAGTASLEANLLQQLMVMMVEVLYEVFLDLRK